MSLVMAFMAVAMYAQNKWLYSQVKKLDKFDDVVWQKQVKTLVTKTDSTIIVETKGQKPVEYRYVDSFIWAEHYGRQDSIINLTKDVYGYESQYFAVTKEAINDARKEVLEETKDLADSLKFEGKMKMLFGLKLVEKMNKLPIITFRTISKSEYIFEYDTDLFWIKFPDDSRLIYSNR